jgi:hypothetical protein
MAQEILRSEDIVEILDFKIHSSADHLNLNVNADELYSDVLTKIENRICSSDQKAAFITALSEPSATNPVVLKEDIETYYSTDDLGEFKDAVNTLAELLALAGPHTLNDMRPVLTEGSIYRWDGSNWVEYISTGTIDHTMLANFDADPDYQHLSLALKTALLTQIHTHANKSVLDQISSVGSGVVISNSERNLIPSQMEKDALEGTEGTPSASNRYVTNIDPRLNTIKNPYLTFGPLGSGASFMGSDISELLAAANAVVANPYIGALEILPNVYSLNTGINTQGFSWLSSDAFLFEALALRESVLEFSPEPAGTIAFYIAAGSGQVHVRGLVIDVSGTSILSALIGRDNTIFEDCVFTSSAPFINGCMGVEITGADCTLLRCTFSGTLNSGVTVLGDGCSIQDCIFELDNPVDALVISANHCKVIGNTFINTAIEVIAASEGNIFDSNRMQNVTFTDGGYHTRWLGGIAYEYQQAYIGRTRTLGSLESYADFRGATEAVFLAALSDPYTKEIEILDASFTFSSDVTLPDGCTLKGVGQNITISGAHCFTLGNSTRISNISFMFTNGLSGITGDAIADAVISDCTLDLAGPDVPAHYAISISNSNNIQIDHCTFSGTRGIEFQNVANSRIAYNILSNTNRSVATDVNTTELHFGDNTYCYYCSFAGERAIIKGNIFKGTLPTKINLIDSLWWGNHPAVINNDNGITKRILSPNVNPILGTGCDVSSFLGTASIAFLETGTPTAVTSQYPIEAPLDRSKGYTLDLHWTASVFSGDVRWEVTTVFRDRVGREIGTPNKKEVTSSRTALSVHKEDKVTVVYADTDYGFISGVDISHVAIKIRRLADSGLDTLPSSAYVTKIQLDLYRD